MFTSDDIKPLKPAVAVIILFVLIAALILWDVVTDYGDGSGWTHIAMELFILLMATAGVAYIGYHLRQTKTRLVAAQQNAEHWRQANYEQIRGFGIAIENQFSRWKLSRAEAEVGFLLLKGLSHKEAAQIRQTSERTIREQARALYRKSGLSGRSSLSAYFLEDLLLPEPADRSDKPITHSESIPL